MGLADLHNPLGRRLEFVAVICSREVHQEIRLWRMSQITIAEALTPMFVRHYEWEQFQGQH